MPKLSRYLITTSDERTWKFDRPVIFLGEWCRLYNRKHIWRDMDAIVAEPYGLGQSAKDADQAEARALEEKLFPILCDALNQHHGTDHNERFWRIIFGHWLRRYIIVILNRVKTLEQCLQRYHLMGTTAYFDEHYSLATLDSYAAVLAVNDCRWNNALYVRILNLLGVTTCPVEVISGDESEGFRLPATATEAPLKKQLWLYGYRQIGRLIGLLARKNDAFIINSYLPKKEEIKLQLALRQVPQLWTSPELKTTRRVNLAIRQSLFNKIESKSNDTLLGITCSLVFELLPLCFLEGYSMMREQVDKLPWPKNPKFIFTSNNFDTDEIFKYWTAKKVEAGSLYIIGQHGNCYGTFLESNDTIEECIADRFLTWGWTEGLAQHTPAIMLNRNISRAVHYDPKGALLLVEDCIRNRGTYWDTTAEFATYFAEQQRFVKELHNLPRNSLIIRLFRPYRYLNWFEDARWFDFDDNLKLDTGDLAMRMLVAKSRLVVQSYDSTGLLESLSQNIPTLAFWQNRFDHLRDSAKPYYELLVDAGIVHLTPESVASKVNEVWNNVEGWWAQSDVQDARKKFCNRYARNDQNPVNKLKKILSTNIP